MNIYDYYATRLNKVRRVLRDDNDDKVVRDAARLLASALNSLAYIRATDWTQPDQPLTLQQVCDHVLNQVPGNGDEVQG